MPAELRQPILSWLRRRAAGTYVVGPNLRDAVASATSMATQGLSTTICFWDGTEDKPDGILARYVETIRAISRARLDSYLSVKAPSLRFDPKLIAELCESARNERVRVHFDSLQVETVDRTRALIELLCANHPHLGCTLPGRWHRSFRDAEWATRLGLNVRVVKGQWRDSQTGDLDPRAGFIQVIDALAGRAPAVAVATHDPALAAAAISKLRRAGTPCELELLFGLPSRSILQLSRELAVPVRFYLPYGEAWLPYALAQASRNPRILYWFVRDALIRNRSSVTHSTIGKSEIA